MGITFNPFTGTLDFTGAGGGGGGTPAAPDTSVQFNNSGSFGGDAGLTWNNTLKRLVVGVDGNSPLETLRVGGHAGTGNGLVNINCINGALTSGEAVDITTSNTDDDVAPADGLYVETLYRSPTGTTGYDVGGINGTLLITGGTGTIPGAWNFRSRITSNGNPTAITEMGGMDLQAPSTLAANVGTAFGLRVGDVSGATANYAIKTGVGLVRFGDAIELIEMTAPSAPAANQARLYLQDNGGGKTQLMILFATGAAQQLAVQA